MYDNQMTMVEATVSTIEELPTGRMATMDNGDRVPVSKKCKTGDRQRYARTTPQLGHRGGNSAVGSCVGALCCCCCVRLQRAKPH